MAPHISSRQENVATANNVAGGLIAGFICIVVLLCLLCLLRFHRSGGNKKRNGEWDVTSFYINGGVRPMMTETNPLSANIPPFSRRGLTASIAMPEKSITRKPSSHGLADKTVASSKLGPSPTSPLFRHRPLSNASFGAPRSRALSILNPACSRQSRSSFGPTTYAQYSFPPGLSSRPSSTISTSPMQAGPAHQLFDPVLPDELSPLRYGEYLTVLRSFDDGWCLVARDTSRSSRLSRLSRLSAMMKSNGDNVDIGLVPAWVFAKPLKSITATRPSRTTSVNALNLGQTPALARDGIVSWSNFA